MIKTKVWVINNKPFGLPKVDDFRCIEEELPPCKEGDFIIEAEVLSVDPYMRVKIPEINAVVVGSQVAKVIESQNEDFPVGTYVIGYPGWRLHTHVSKEQLNSSHMPSSYLPSSYLKVPDLGEVPRSTALGILGMPGNTAYFGFLEICQPQAGETVVVNTAAGAVGSLVCQLAKMKGCKVVAFAGSDEKVSWLKELGVDHAFNYKTTSVSQALTMAAPDGINCYFDNVGGKFTAEVLPHMAEYGRISVCGCISSYNDESKDTGAVSLKSPFSEMVVLWKQLRVEGFIVTSRWAKQWMEGLNQMKEWVLEGKLKYKECVTKGFENMPKAFIGLFHGENFGKSVVFV